MNFDEQDINFLSLTDKEFEELCFDLLLRLGYKGLVWRQGGADSGRDIEGRLSVNNSLVDKYEERWFFECKRYEKGIPPEAINSKIAWADAEKPKHFVIFVSSYLSNSTRIWLEKISSDKSYIIHTIESKQLKQLLLGFPEIISEYFLDDYTKLLIDSRKTWLIHNLLPDLGTLSTLLNDIDEERLSVNELAFLWCSAKIRTSEVCEWPDNCKQFYMDSMFTNMARFNNTSARILSLEDIISIDQASFGSIVWELTYSHYIVICLVLKKLYNSRKALYSFVRDNKGEGVEVLIEAAGDFPTKVRHIQVNAEEEEKYIIDIFAKVNNTKKPNNTPQ